MGARLKVAVTMTAVDTLTVQVSVAPEQAPVHPPKTEPGVAVAVRVTSPPLGKTLSQLSTHELAPREKLTFPAPVPDRV